MTRENSFGQQIGEPVEGWTPRPRPGRKTLIGRYCRIEPLDPERHAAELHAANHAAGDDRFWTYLPIDAFDDLAPYRAWLDKIAAGEDPLFFVIRDGIGGQACGICAYLRIDPTMGSIEIGHINLAPRLQKTRAATEAMFLLMAHAFDDLGYRRYEWKCDSLNAPSREAAKRFGFTYEGIFRNAQVYKGRNRDTAWFSITDAEWPIRRAGFEAWLDPANFDEAGRQRSSLSVWPSTP